MGRPASKQEVAGNRKEKKLTERLNGVPAFNVVHLGRARPRSGDGAVKMEGHGVRDQDSPPSASDPLCGPPGGEDCRGLLQGGWARGVVSPGPLAWSGPPSAAWPGPRCQCSRQTHCGATSSRSSEWQAVLLQLRCSLQATHGASGLRV
ncbi:hypothetical protein SKAU_G00317630 [Synaphobranchus kaupii]|uniref:Uncharacterized protein n=1 Tax=Synaphobranchus kaupii TaxID=118154 RepID=A0A9Q1ET03_SYNKA|nr:hypothetical protein SKAU_G00317630 [Synaphobranchus kaupii]